MLKEEQKGVSCHSIFFAKFTAICYPFVIEEVSNKNDDLSKDHTEKSLKIIGLSLL